MQNTLNQIQDRENKDLYQANNDVYNKLAGERQYQDAREDLGVQRIRDNQTNERQDHYLQNSMNQAGINLYRDEREQLQQKLDVYADQVAQGTLDEQDPTYAVALAEKLFTTSSIDENGQFRTGWKNGMTDQDIQSFIENFSAPVTTTDVIEGVQEANGNPLEVASAISSLNPRELSDLLNNPQEKNQLLSQLPTFLGNLPGRLDHAEHSGLKEGRYINYGGSLFKVLSVTDDSSEGGWFNEGTDRIQYRFINPVTGEIISTHADG